MGAAQKLAGIGVAAVIVIGAGAYWGYEYLHRNPSNEEVLNFAREHMAVPGQKIVEISTGPVPPGTSTIHTGSFSSGTKAGFSDLANYNAAAPRAGVVQMKFTATVESTEALYDRVATDQYIQQQGGDPAVFRKIQGILRGPNAATIRDLAGITGPVDDFNGKTLIHEVTPQGHRYTTTGIINALRQGGQWQMAVAFGPLPDKDAPVGYKLSSFNGQVLSLSQPDQAKKINGLINQAAATLQSLQQAQARYRANLQATQQLAKQQRAAPAGPAHIGTSSPGASPPAHGYSSLNMVSIPPGTVIQVTTDEAVDTSNLRRWYNAETAVDIALPDAAGVSKGSSARVTIVKVGNAFQVRLNSLVVNGAWVTLNTDQISLGTIAPSGSTTGQKQVIDAGQSYQFHQL
jgi:hypothetical protein